MTKAQNFPDMGLEKTEVIVVKISGQIGVIGDHERQVQCATVNSTPIVEACDPQQCWLSHVQHVRPEIDQVLAHRGVWQGEAEFRIERKR